MRSSSSASSAPAADPRTASRIEIGVFGPWETNAYLVWDGRSTDALVLDPGMGAADPLIGARSRANGLRLHLIANSHGHIDHIFDNAPLMRRRRMRRSRSTRTTRIGSTAETATGSSCSP